MDVLPHNRETELQVLGTLIRYNEHYLKVSDILNVTSFYDVALSNVYRCVADVIEGGGITDAQALEAKGREHRQEIPKMLLAEIMGYCSESTILQDALRLRRYEQQRLLWQTYTAAATRVCDPLADIDEEIENVSKVVDNVRSTQTSDGIATFAQAFEELDGIIADNYQGRHEYIETGFDLIDKHYLLRPCTLTIVAAFTSVGKSALAMNIGVRAAQSGAPVAYYSLEMGKAELAARAISKAAKMTAGHIMNARLNETEKIVYREAVEQVADLPLYIDELSTTSFARTMRSIRRMARTRGVRLAIIDYLQIYTQTGERVEEGLAAMAREAKNVAKETGIAVVLLSQLNRSSNHPSIRMLRGSGQIEESADNVILIDRPAAYPDGGHYEGRFANEDTRDTALLILAKGRGVGIGDELVGFDAEHTTFYPLVKDPKPFGEPINVDWDDFKN